MVQLLHLECFAHQHIQIFICPLLSRHRLQEQHSVLVIHFHEVGSEFQKQHCAHVTMELAEAFLLSVICVPQPNNLVAVELAGEVTRDPPVCEVHKH